MREEQSLAYQNWAKNPNKENMAQIIKSVDKLIGSEVMRYSGTLRPSLLKSYAKRYVADAVRTYDPSSPAHISTHIVNSLKRLHRLNYKNVQGMKSSEQIQSKINTYLTTQNTLLDRLGRDPTPDEMAKEMNLTPKMVKRIRDSMKTERDSVLSDSTPSVQYEYDPEREALDYLYHDVKKEHPLHAKIIEYKTGYGGAPIKQNIEIAKELGLSPVRVSQIAESLGEKLKLHLGGG